jgi:hypothetical protein
MYDPQKNNMEVFKTSRLIIVRERRGNLSVDYCSYRCIARQYLKITLSGRRVASL